MQGGKEKVNRRLDHFKSIPPMLGAISSCLPFRSLTHTLFRPGWAFPLSHTHSLTSWELEEKASSVESVVTFFPEHQQSSTAASVGHIMLHRSVVSAHGSLLFTVQWRLWCDGRCWVNYFFLFFFFFSAKQINPFLMLYLKLKT